MNKMLEILGLYWIYNKPAQISKKLIVIKKKSCMRILNIKGKYSFLYATYKDLD